MKTAIDQTIDEPFGAHTTDWQPTEADWDKTDAFIRKMRLRKLAETIEVLSRQAMDASSPNEALLELLAQHHLLPITAPDGTPVDPLTLDFSQYTLKLVPKHGGAEYTLRTA